MNSCHTPLNELKAEHDNFFTMNSLVPLGDHQSTAPIYAYAVLLLICICFGHRFEARHAWWSTRCAAVGAHCSCLNFYRCCLVADSTPPPPRPPRPSLVTDGVAVMQTIMSSLPLCPVILVCQSCVRNFVFVQHFALGGCTFSYAC
jgi:hypothetical protein